MSIQPVQTQHGRLHGLRPAYVVTAHVVHSQTVSHVPTRILTAAAQLQGVTLQVQYLTLAHSCTHARLSISSQPTSFVIAQPFFHLLIRNMTGAEPSRVSVICSCAISHLVSGRNGSKQVCWLCRLVVMPSPQPAPSRRMSAD